MFKALISLLSTKLCFNAQPLKVSKGIWKTESKAVAWLGDQDLSKKSNAHSLSQEYIDI